MDGRYSIRFQKKKKININKSKRERKTKSARNSIIEGSYGNRNNDNKGVLWHLCGSFLHWPWGCYGHVVVFLANCSLSLFFFSLFIFFFCLNMPYFFEKKLVSFFCFCVFFFLLLSWKSSDWWIPGKLRLEGLFFFCFFFFFFFKGIVGCPITTKKK